MSEQSTVQHQEPPASDVEEGRNVWLDWRMDPVERYSDWKIEISVGDKIQGTYHVHRCILSGESTYFARLFANTSLKEHETRTSNIVMDGLAAKAFPLMLDYLYRLWDNDSKPIGAENAVALHHLGCYFEIFDLRKEIRAFWASETMTVDQAVTYLEHATIFHDDLARGAVAEQCVRLIGSITVDDSRLMEVLDAEFLLAVLKRNKGEPNPELSTLVSSFCSKNKEALDAEAFLQLTDMSLLPQLSAASAMQLLQLEKHFIPTFYAASAVKVSSLQERVLGAFLISSSSSKVLNHSLTEQLQHLFNALPPIALSRATALLVGKMEYQNRMVSVVPKKVVVSNVSGVFKVNGTYSRTSDFHERAPCFAMACDWNGSPTEFKMYRKAIEEGHGGRIKYIWFIGKGTRSISDEDEDLYYAPQEEGLLLPPSTGWKRCSTGYGSTTMVLRFHFDELPSDSDV